MPCNLKSDHDQGQFRIACNQQYFFSNVSKNFSEAYTECCKYGMRLISFETMQEIQCLIEMNIGTLFYVRNRV